MVLNKLKCNIIPNMNIYLYVDCVINPLVTCIIIIFTLNIIFLHSGLTFVTIKSRIFELNSFYVFNAILIILNTNYFK